MTEPTHGRYSTYTNHGCKCELCMNAMREYRRNIRYRRQTGEPPRERKPKPPIVITEYTPPHMRSLVRDEWVETFADWQNHEQELDERIVLDVAARAQDTLVYGRSVTACPRGYWRGTKQTAEDYVIATVTKREKAREENRRRSRLYQQKRRMQVKVGVRKRYAR